MAANPVAAPYIYTPPMHPYISVVHMDEDLLVLSKPSGLLSVPGKHPAYADCMESRAREAYPQALVTHRLDRSTSGLMLMALNKRAQSQIGKHFEARLIGKIYIARVWGQVQGESGLIDLPLRADWPNRPKQRVDYERGKPSQTEWRVLERDAVSTRMELKPLTGRSHQLRMHMLSTGHPILGDTLYAHDDARGAAPRLQLHAQSLTLHHPRSNKLVTFTDLCPF